MKDDLRCQRRNCGDPATQVGNEKSDPSCAMVLLCDHHAAEVLSLGKGWDTKPLDPALLPAQRLL